ncbi:MAG: hypothetical protein ING44_15665 [Telmatospirillum sp.]|nr:hypothetical protein [Telmatospirillum sp.]
MRAAGQRRDIERIERHFWIVLCLFDSVHQALADAAKKLDMTDWRDDLNQLRENDPLLKYIWCARNSEVHDAFVKWQPSMKHMNIRVIDPAKVSRVAGWGNEQSRISRIFCFIYSVQNLTELMQAIKDGALPSADRQIAAGVEVIESLDSLALRDFDIGQGRKRQKISAPELHQGKAIPPSADEAVFHTLSFYESKFQSIKAVAAGKAAIAKP